MVQDEREGQPETEKRETIVVVCDVHDVAARDAALNECLDEEGVIRGWVVNASFGRDAGCAAERKTCPERGAVAGELPPWSVIAVVKAPASRELCHALAQFGSAYELRQPRQRLTALLERLRERLWRWRLVSCHALLSGATWRHRRYQALRQLAEPGSAPSRFQTEEISLDLVAVPPPFAMNRLDLALDIAVAQQRAVIAAFAPRSRTTAMRGLARPDGEAAARALEEERDRAAESAERDVPLTPVGVG